MQGEIGVLPGIDIEGYKLPRRRTIKTRCKWNPVLRYHLVQSKSDLDWMLDVLRWAQDAGPAWDTEGSGLKPELGARICGHAFACRTGEREITGWYVPMRHIGPHNEFETQLAPELVTERLRPIFAEGGELATFHGKYDAKMARADNLWLTRPWSDVSIEATAHNENEPRFGLKWLAAKYCTPKADAEEKELEDWLRRDARKLGLVFRKYTKSQRARMAAKGLDALGALTYLERFGYSRAPIKLAARYAIHDVFYTWWLSHVKYRYVRTAFPDLWQREHEVARMLLDMEWYGLEADEEKIRDTHERTRVAVEHWLAECKQLAPGLVSSDFAGSDQELRQLFFDGLKMQPPKFTGRNQPSVDRETRKLLIEKYPEHAGLLKAVDHLAKVVKLHTTYAGNYLRYYSAKTGCIHPTYNQLEQREEEGGVPVTGRMSSADPNAQNVNKKPLHLWDCLCPKCLHWPDKTEADAINKLIAGGPVENFVDVHSYFVVPKGYVRFYIDFSQVELRMLAWFCQDPTMLEAFREGRDLHQAIADELGIERDIAKQVNFGNSYGMTEWGLALRLPGYYRDPEGTRERAKHILEAYFGRFPRILAFRRDFARLARRNGCTFVNPFGRPRRIIDLAADGEDRWKRGRAERMMMSSIISGTCADLLKEAMRRTNPTVQAAAGRMVQTIHDELIFDVPMRSGWSGVLRQLIHQMEDWPQFSEDRPGLSWYSPGRFGVPIKVSAEVTTTSWSDKREIELVGEERFRWAA